MPHVVPKNLNSMRVWLLLLPNADNFSVVSSKTSMPPHRCHSRLIATYNPDATKLKHVPLPAHVLRQSPIMSLLLCRCRPLLIASCDPNNI
eukprot:scaffold20819_cov21-Tisochrysis_lutea.AAC.1